MIWPNCKLPSRMLVLCPRMPLSRNESCLLRRCMVTCLGWRLMMLGSHLSLTHHHLGFPFFPLIVSLPTSILLRRLLVSRRLSVKLSSLLNPGKFLLFQHLLWLKNFLQDRVHLPFHQEAFWEEGREDRGGQGEQGQ